MRAAFKRVRDDLAGVLLVLDLVLQVLDALRKIRDHFEQDECCEEQLRPVDSRIADSLAESARLFEARGGGHPAGHVDASHSSVAGIAPKVGEPGPGSGPGSPCRPRAG